MRVKKWLGRGAVFCLIPAVALLLDHFYPLKVQRSFSTVVLANNGEILRAFSNSEQEWRYPVENKDVPVHYLALLLGYEDRWFYWHFGVNPLSIIRAAWQNWQAGKVVSGGSTLTMQVARLMHPHERSLAGKFTQLFRAMQLEWHYSKAEILNLYLNLAPFGGTLIGVQAASISYFDKTLEQLSDAEAALLAVLPQAPSRWHPNRYPKAAKQARDKVLRRMLQLQIWPAQRVEDALQEPIFSLAQQTPMSAPLLARRLRKQCPSCEKITSFIDIEMQQQLEELVADYSQQFAQGVSIALMVMENDTGAVRSYIGSANFLDNQRFAHVDMIKAVRSPGSTLKPFLYAMAIDRGIVHSHSLLQDVPRHQKAYRPNNFSGGFNGPVSVSEALQRSLNIPAVQVLEQLKPQYFAAKLESAGLRLYWPSNKGANLSMILGGVGVKLENLVASYSALARSGVAIKARLTPKEPIVERHMLSAGAAWISWKMLAINPALSARSQFVQSHWPLAWKTGTSYGYREAWAMGVSKKWSIGVWVGRPDGSGSVGLSGRTSAAPLLFKAYRAISSDSTLEQPNTVSEQQICWPLGTLETDASNSFGNCQQKHRAWILNNTAAPTLSEWPLLKTLWYNRAGERSSPSCDSAYLQQKQLAFWPVSLEPWIAENWRRAARIETSNKNCIFEETERLSISSVVDDSVYKLKREALSLLLQSSGGSGVINWYLNGKFVVKGPSVAALSLQIQQIGRYQLSAIDEQGNSDIVSFSIKK